MELEKLKNQYAILAEKHKLPDFTELNEEFEIDKLDKDTDCLLRDIRKRMLEKVVNSMGFFENLLNPANLSRIYLVYIKNMTSEDKQDIENMYGKLGDLSLASLELEIDYSEKKEAELIVKITHVWKSIKPSFRKMVSKMMMPSSESKPRKERSYFG